MSATELLSQATRTLSESGLDTPRLDAEILTAHVLGLDRIDLLSGGQLAVPSDSANRLAGLLQRRCDGEPVARIVGSKEFWSLPFAMSQYVLVPRPETELLVEAALNRMRAGIASQTCRVLDLGTGSGCVLLALLHELAEATGVGVDIDTCAIETAKANAGQLGLDRRAEFRAADWRDGKFSGAELGRFDLILSNPPYVPSAEIASLAPEVSAFDPRIALDGGEDGLNAYRQIFSRLTDLCTPDAHVFVECGAGQRKEVVSIAEKCGWTFVDTYGDLAGIERVIEFCAAARLQ